MPIIATVAYYLLLIFLLAMWARFIFDWVRVLSRNWRPKGFVLLLAEASYTVTDPPIRVVRKVVPPLRIGAAAIDFGWTIVLIVCIVLMQVAARLA